MKYHRIRDVLAGEAGSGKSVRSAAKKMELDKKEISRQIKPECPITLAQLFRWAEYLDTPVVELICDPDDEMDPRVAMKATLIRAMKAVNSLEEVSDQRATRLIQYLKEQLLDIMPELEGVKAFPIVGQRKNKEDLARIEEEQIQDGDNLIRGFDDEE